MNIIQKTCDHLENYSHVLTEDHACEECVKTGSSWIHLRTCQTCGVTLCCDSSPHKHSRKHFHATGHPVVESAEPQDHWAYCYEDRAFKTIKK